MAGEETRLQPKKGSIRGRESRNETVTTKLTEAEHEAIRRAASTEGKTTGEWLRDLALAALRQKACNREWVVLSEVVGVRLLLVNALRSIGTGQKLTPEAFDRLLDEIGATKHELAAKLLLARARS